MASRFCLMNEKKQRWDLNSPASGVFTKPQGFGMENSSSYLKTGDVWLTDSKKLSQPKISGIIVFPERMYAVFQEFMQFLNQSKKTVFVYKPSGVDAEYFADVDLVGIEKGNYARGQRFEVSASFVCKSLFYTEEQFEYHIKRADREVRWDFRWETRFNDLNYVYFRFENTGHVESPFSLSFTGHCTDAAMMVYQEGRLINQVRFNLTLLGSETLSISTFDDDLRIEVDGADRKDCLDFTNDNFFKLPIGASEVFFRSRTGKMNNIILNMEKYYKAV